MKLQLSNYTPNFSDPRIIKKITKALTWATDYYFRWKPFQLHSVKDIRANFGNAENNQLAKYLVSKLLVNEGAGFVVGKRAMLYKINKAGFDELQSKLVELNECTVYFRTDTIKNKYKDELAGLKQFQYNDISYRLWHSLQYVPTELKSEIFNPEIWSDWDISAALPTIFCQLHDKWAVEHGFTPATEGLNFIKEYLSRKKEIREELMQLLNISKKKAKKIINGLFLGARLVAHSKCTIFQELGYDFERMELLKNNSFIVGLVDDIKTFWAKTGKWLNEVRVAQGEEQIPKTHLYFYYERLVLNEVQAYLISQNLPFFLEHDGFKVMGTVNTIELKQLVSHKLGLALDWE